MAGRKTRLELTWIGKDERPRLEPRILLEEPELSYRASGPVSEDDLFDNMLIHGDNLLVLKALHQQFAGTVRCIFIDPPYNTGHAFEHYDDGVQHSIWLSLMRDRLTELRDLLTEDGSIWVTLDDNEAHYLKVVADEVFGRSNFIGTIVWEKSDSPRMDAQFLSSRHDFILVYAKSRDEVHFKPLSVNEVPKHYNKTDEDGRAYYLKPLRAMGGQGETRESRPNLYFPITAPDGTTVYPVRQDGTDGAWRWSRKKVETEHHRIEWTKSKRKGWSPNYRIYASTNQTRPPESIWFHSDVGSNRTSKAEVKAVLPETAPFGTPKPEALLKRILEIATEPGDLVLDSFAGSGTTGAVAHKMRRRWILVELGEHAKSHAQPRLVRVVEGTDTGGISQTVGWNRGGGFQFYRLAPSLLQRDKWGNWVVSEEYDGPKLAEAMCKLHGFQYDPDPDAFWLHGRSTETDFLYVTDQTLTADQLQFISDEVGSERSLLVCCRAWRAEAKNYANLTLEKIPQSVLSKCEWDRDDYSLNVQELTPGGAAFKQNDDGETNHKARSPAVQE